MKNVYIFLLLGVLAVFSGCINESSPISRDYFKEAPISQLATNRETLNSPVIISNIAVENYFRIGTNEQTFINVPNRIFVIGASQIDTVLDLNMGQAIIGAVKYEDSKEYPIKASNQNVYKNLSFVSRSQINIESLLTLQPDLIIGEESWYSKNKLGSTAYWNEKGIHTMVTPGTTHPMKVADDETVEDQMEYILNLGRVFNQEQQAKYIVDATEGRIKEIAYARVGKKKPKVLILDLLSATVSYGSNKVAGDLVNRIGGEVPHTTAPISDELLMRENPDIVFVVTYDSDTELLDSLLTKPQFQALNFVKYNRVYAIPLKYVYGPLSRTIDAAGYMANYMYPDEFNFEKEYDFHK